MFRNILAVGLPALGIFCAQVSLAAPDTRYTACVMEQVATAPESLSVGEIRQSCADRADAEAGAELAGDVEPEPAVSTGAVARRFAIERATDLVRFVITPHKPNYLISSYNFSGYDDDAFEEQFGEKQNFTGGEVDFQVSFKFPVVKQVFNTRSSLMFAYTNRSFWQLFDDRDSRPFRETNHEPDAWLSWSTNRKIFGLTNRIIDVGLSHQSNGRGGSLSRSWNRLYTRFVFEHGNTAFVIKPWYRIPEKKKDDDNRDIEEYLGHFEFQGVYKHSEHLFELFFRNTLKDDYRGALQLGWSFPVSDRLKGYVQYYYGYGESLIDYNNKVNKLGIGIKLTDWL